jgi:hypothetical protein
MNNEVPLTMSVPEAGERYFDLSRNGSYNAAAKGIRSGLAACCTSPCGRSNECWTAPASRRRDPPDPHQPTDCPAPARKMPAGVRCAAPAKGIST